MKILRLIAISILLQVHAYAQSNHKAGYVIKSNGDTLKGFVNYKEWIKNPPFIEFKSTISDKENIKFQPKMLQSFEVAGMDKYVSYAGPLSMDNNTFPDLPTQLDTTTVQDTVFLRVAYTGSPLQLLTYQDKTKLRIFVQDGSELPVELKYYRYYVDGSTTRASEKYKIKLMALALKYNRYEELKNLIERTGFREEDLTKVLKRINKDDSHLEANAISGSRFFAGFAFNRTITEFNGQNQFSGVSSTGYTPRINIGYDVFTNKHTQQLVLRGELSLGYIKPRFSTANRLSTDNSQIEYRFDQFTATITPQILYNIYNTDAVKVYLGAGAGFNYSIYSNNQLVKKGYDIMYTDYYELAKLWMSFPVQAGVTFNKKIEIFAQYVSPTAYTKYSSFSISNKTYGVGIRYLLK
jgi:hypothetical protein